MRERVRARERVVSTFEGMFRETEDWEGVGREGDGFWAASVSCKFSVILGLEGGTEVGRKEGWRVHCLCVFRCLSFCVCLAVQGFCNCGLYSSGLEFWLCYISSSFVQRVFSVSFHVVL